MITVRSAVRWSVKTTVRSTSTSSVTDVPSPRCDDSEKIYPEKIQRLVSDISHLSLLEASQLNELLKVGPALNYGSKCKSILFYCKPRT